MKLTRWVWTWALTVAATIAFATPAVAQNYTITDLGVLSPAALGGLTTTADTDSMALGINASGSVIGVSGAYDTSSFANLGFYVQHAFLWTPNSANGTTGTMTYLGGLPGNYCFVPDYFDPYTGVTKPAHFDLFDTIPNSINSAGQVVGQSYTSTGTCPHEWGPTLAIHGALWQNGRPPQDLGVPPWLTSTNGFYLIDALSINDQGKIVGYTQPGQLSNSGGADAWFFDGSFHDLSYLPEPCSDGTLCLNLAIPSQINSSGTIVGTAWAGGSTIVTSVAPPVDPRAFAHKGAGPLQASDDLGTLGGPDSAATGINEAGLIVGAATTSSGAVHAFWINTLGQMVDLGTASIDPMSNSNALAINRANDIVGWSDIDPQNSWNSSQHAMMWENGQNPIDLNSLLLRNAITPLGPLNGRPGVQCLTCWELIDATGINDLGQIVGVGLLNGQRHAFLLTPSCSSAGGDSDGDGLCDDWEKFGYTAPDGTKVDLPAMGADPMHKDIFVQADYMVNFGDPCDFSKTPPCNGHTHQFTPEALNSVTAAFASAPVSNPDGFTGIRLHVDCGPDCVMNPITGKTWGSLSLAQEMTEIPLLGTATCGTPPDFSNYCWDLFNVIKAANFPMSRAPIFHYMIFAHSLADANGAVMQASGISGGIPDSDFIVALGGSRTLVGTRLQQAGTFMHELGHNLGLQHGGTDFVNYKPNYLSVMNYFFQQDGLYKDTPAGTTSGGYLDYSRFFSIPDLNENNLNEAIGLDGGGLLNHYGTAWYCPGGNAATETGITYDTSVNLVLNWNCNKALGENNVQADLTGNYGPTGMPIFSVLHGAEDWSRLIYNGGAIGAAGAGLRPRTYRNSDPETVVPNNNQAPYRIEVSGLGAAQVAAGVSFNATFTVSNTGVQADTYNLSAVSASNWWTTTGIPNTVTLAGGASQQITVPVSVSGCNTSGTQGRFTFTAVSQTSPTVADSVLEVLRVLPNPPGSIAVPNVIGLTQADAQTAIVNAGLTVGSVTMQSSSTVPTGTVISQSPSDCAVAPTGTSVSLTVSSGVALIAVPNVVGKPQEDAITTLAGAGLVLGSAPVGVPSTIIPAGDVVSQNPPAGTMATPGSIFTLTIATTPSNYAVMPNIVGVPFSSAVTTIATAGLNLGLISNAFSLTVPAGTVMSQDPAAGSPISLGNYVNVTVSYGDGTTKVVPNIVGDTQATAISAILTAGLSIGSIGEAASNTVRAGIVTLQSPLPTGGIFGSAPADSPVSFSISTGPVGPQSFVVPNVYGLTQSAAASAITAAGLTVGTITPTQYLSMPVGNVFSQTPSPGSYANGGSAVNLQVSAAAAQYTVPDFVTKPTYYAAAYAGIIAAGLTPGTFTSQMSTTVSYGNVISQSPAAGTVVAGSSAVNVTYSVGFINPAGTNVVPNLVGYTQALAETIAGSGFYISVTREPSTTVPDGFVISQDPPANAQGIFLQPINLFVSSGEPVIAAIPNVVGIPITRGFGTVGAEPTLNAAGFAVGSVTYQPSDSVPSFQVISQDPPAGTIAAWDTSVSLIYSSGPPSNITVPNLVGKTQGLAIATLGAASLKWTLTTQSSQTVAAGVVISQNPSAGTVLQGVIPGTGGEQTVPVTFVVSAGPKAVPTYSLLKQFGDFGSGYSGDGQFGVIASLAFDPNTGNILAGDQTGRIQIFDRNGNFKGYFGGNGVQFVTSSVSGTSQLATFYPTGTGGGLFGTGTFVTAFNTPGQFIVGFPVGLAVDPINGNVVALDAADRVLIFNSAGVLQSTFGSPGTGPGQFSSSAGTTFVGGVAIDPVTENILVADWGNNRVQIFSSTGVYLSQFGTQGAGNGQFGYGPSGIAVDPATRNIVVMDSGTVTGTARVEIFNSSGSYLSQFGAPVQAAGASWTSCGCAALAIDAASHNIIVQGAISDQFFEPTIQIFDSQGNYLSQFGGYGTTYGGGLAVDPVSHHIVTFGLAGINVGTVQIWGEPLALTPTATVLTSSLNPANFGHSVSLTATITGFSPTGTVQFMDGVESLGSPVILAAGVATLTTSTLTGGTHSITAVYNGDGVNATSTSGVLSETILASTTSVVTSSLNPATFGQPVTFTASVSGNSPTGTVQFMDGTSTLGAPITLTAGSAGLTTSSLAGGTHSITAVYSGDVSNTPSTSAVLSEVISLKTTTTTSVATSADPAPPGQLVTFTASVTGSSPTGTIQFMDGTASLGAPVPLTAGVATFATTTLSVGTHLIEAAYSGDSANFASTSSPLSEIISSATTTTTTVVTSLTPSVTGQSVTFTATVAGNNPTGTVQFVDSASSLGSPVNLTGNTATLTLSTLSAGTHSITATYGGDSSNLPSASTPMNEVVSPTTTTTILVTSLNPAATGQAITLTATVTGYNPTGTIRFFDGTTQLGAPVELGASVTLVGPTIWIEPSLLQGGKAALTSALFSAGTHPITAVYSGNNANSTSTSTVLNEVVSAASAAPPVVTPPTSISISATQAGGSTPNASAALAAFLAGGSATSTLSVSPMPLVPQVGGVAVGSSTLFPVGTTTVTFRFEDANGNIGSATATVTVIIGTPRVTGSVKAMGTDPSGAIYVDVVLTNTGTGNARNLTINTVVPRVLSGSGAVSYNAALSPALPFTIGSLDVGASATTRIYLNVPSTVTRISITEGGPLQDVTGTSYNYSTAEAFVP